MEETILDKLAQYSTPELCDGMEVFRTMDPGIRGMAAVRKIIGPALTVSVPIGEGGFIPEAILAAKPGDIIVIAGGGNVKSSYWGDMRSQCALLAGVAGVVVDGAFRDIEGCEEIGLPIYARAVTPGTALKTNKGQLKVPVSCGGVTVNPGDIIVGDQNGVCVLRPDELEEVLKRTARKVAAQAYTMEKMRRTGQILPRVIFPENAGE